MAGEMKLMRWQHIRRLTERTDKQGNPVPFRLRYVTQRGSIIDQENVVTTSVDVKNKMRNVKFLDSGQVRTIHDVLILQINDTKIIVN